jgi:hypothetical protein
MMISEEQKAKLENDFYESVKGCTITRCYYDPGTNMPVLILSNGNGIFIQCDDEGNGAGVPVAVIGAGDDQTEVGMWQIR